MVLLVAARSEPSADVEACVAARMKSVTTMGTRSLASGKWMRVAKFRKGQAIGDKAQMTRPRGARRVNVSVFRYATRPIRNDKRDGGGTGQRQGLAAVARGLGLVAQHSTTQHR